MYPSGHGGGGGGTEVAGAVDVVDDLSGAANGADEVDPEVVGVEVLVLGAGAGAGKIGVDITWTANGGEEGGSGEVGVVAWIYGLEPELGRSDPEFQLDV